MTKPIEPSLEFFLLLEHGVWQALQTGDLAADAALLSDRFLGVYPSGLSDRSGHADQLLQGPSVHSYVLSEHTLLTIDESSYLLVYRADYCRRASAEPQAMWVSSLWQKQDECWQCLFSQDTPISNPS